MKFGLFYLPSIALREEIEQGMAGQNPVLYQRMLKEIGEQARLADDAGYDSIGFTEHHFHVEGYEISNNPVMLDLFVGMQTKRIKVGQLGVVLPAASPLRVGRTCLRRIRARLSKARGQYSGPAIPRFGFGIRSV
jgi:hypothetical protein